MWDEEGREESERSRGFANEIMFGCIGITKKVELGFKLTRPPVLLKKQREDKPVGERMEQVVRQLTNGKPKPPGRTDFSQKTDRGRVVPHIGLNVEDCIWL